MSSDTCDIVIIGGGVTGCSCAYNLFEKDAGLNAIVVEKGSTYWVLPSSSVGHLYGYLIDKQLSQNSPSVNRFA